MPSVRSTISVRPPGANWRAFTPSYAIGPCRMQASPSPAQSPMAGSSSNSWRTVQPPEIASWSMAATTMVAPFQPASRADVHNEPLLAGQRVQTPATKLHASGTGTVAAAWPEAGSKGSRSHDGPLEPGGLNESQRSAPQMSAATLPRLIRARVKGTSEEFRLLEYIANLLEIHTLELLQCSESTLKSLDGGGNNISRAVASPSFSLPVIFSTMS
mmetsp:Transcript_65682/g.182795  ORF Transcript_65682/g.182795 Transcript_65682/m.182795 type:complete len:215 (-) Transcript_65682:2150-2794(-)